MSDSNAPFTLQDFQDSHANSGAYEAEAEIHYTVDGEHYSFESPLVSGFFSQTLITDGTIAAVAWRYPNGLQEGFHHHDAKNLSKLAFHLGLKAYSGEQAGGMDVNLEYFNDEYGIITGTIGGITIEAEGKVITFRGRFTYRFPEALRR